MGKNRKKFFLLSQSIEIHVIKRNSFVFWMARLFIMFGLFIMAIKIVLTPKLAHYLTWFSSSLVNFIYLFIYLLFIFYFFEFELKEVVEKLTFYALKATYLQKLFLNLSCLI